MKQRRGSEQPQFLGPVNAEGQQRHLMVTAVVLATRLALGQSAFLPNLVLQPS